MRYVVRYHPHVVQNDIPSLDTEMKRRIRNAIANKLSMEPIAHSKPLQHSLKQCRALRVGDYRVIFILQKSDIHIVAIVHRSKDYKGVDRRIE